MLSRKQVVLVCTGNTCRSPMAEGLLKSLAEEENGISIASAGIAAAGDEQALAEAVAAAFELGADISRHRSRPLNQELVVQAGLIIAMTQEHVRWLKHQYPEQQEKIFLLGELARDQSWPEVEEPLGTTADDYRRVAAELDMLLREAYFVILDKLQAG